MTSSGAPEQTPAPDAPRSPGGAEAEQPADQATGAASTADTVSASDAERSPGGRQAEQPADQATNTRSTAHAAPAPDAAQAPDAPNADQDQVDDPAQTVTSPRLEHLQQTIDGAQQAADQALGPQRT